MLGFQTPVVVVGGTAIGYLVLILLSLRRHRFDSWLSGLFFLYLLLGIVWSLSKAIAIAQGMVPLVNLYADSLAIDTLTLLPILLAVLTLLFLERKGWQRIGITGIMWAAVIMLVDGNLLGVKDALYGLLGTATPAQTLQILVLLGWAGFTGGALVIAVWDYIRIQRPLHRNRILYWVTATLFIASGEGLAQTPDAVMLQVGAFLRLLGVLIMAYVTLTYYLPSVRNVIRQGFSTLLITVVTAGLILSSFMLIQYTSPWFPVGYAFIGPAVVAVLLAIVIQPLRRAAADFLDKTFIGVGYDPARALRDYNAAITNILDLEMLVTMAIGIISEALEVRRGTLLLITEHDTARTEVRVIPGMGEVAIQNAEFDPDSPIFARLRDQGQAISQYEIDILPDLRVAPLWERTWLEQLNMELYIPIRRQSVLVGIWALGGKAGGAPYTTQDLNVLSTLADQTAVALQNARLVSDLKHLNAEMTALNDQLTRTNRRLEKLDAAKTHFIQISSHELRTPLTQIRGYADIMADAIQSGTPTPAQMAQISQGISRATVRLEEIISALLDVSEIDAEALSLHRTPLALSSVMRIVSETHDNALKQRKQTLTVANLEHLPKIHGDLQRLCQAINNIVGNCIKFTPDGGSIRISGQHMPSTRGDTNPSGYVELLVSDTGIGIDAEDQELVFEKFYRVGSPDLHSTGSIKFKGAGPGLGLPIARGVIQAHGGKVWVESPGHDEVSFPGSTFHILLPAAEELSKQVAAGVNAAH